MSRRLSITSLYLVAGLALATLGSVGAVSYISQTSSSRNAPTGGTSQMQNSGSTTAASISAADAAIANIQNQGNRTGYLTVYGKSPEILSTPTLKLPIEVINDGASEEVRDVYLNIKPNDLTTTTSLAFTCHRCAFVGAPEWEKTNRTKPVTVKASVRMVGGIRPGDPASGSVPWIDLSQQNVDQGIVRLPTPELLQGGLGVSSMYTTRIEIPLDAAARARLTAGEEGNLVQFRFNGTDGESNGFRIVNLNFKKDNGYHVTVNPVQWANFSIEKNQDYSAADVAQGEQLWNGTARRLIKSSIVRREINASCASCHAENGRDLQYFNYSNHSIVQRARFHGLSAAQGQQIAAFIRSANKNVVAHVAQAAPWNPPYQPGPGIDGRDITEWAAGAGLDAVLDEPVAAINALLGKPLNSPLSSITQMEIDDALSPKKVQNARTIATSLQFPDWNAWLPSISPEDVWPDDNNADQAHFKGSFNKGGIASGDDDPDRWKTGRVRNPKQLMEEADKWLTAKKPATPGDWSHLSSAESHQIANLLFNLGWESWRFVGGNRGTKAAYNGTELGGEAGARNLRARRDPTTSSWNPTGTNDNSFLERAWLSMAQWQSVQQWNLVQKHRLEGNQRWFIGDKNSTAEKFNRIGEDRGWALQTPGVFIIAPHFAYEPLKQPGSSAPAKDANGQESLPVLQWEDAKDPGPSYYRSNIWYDLAMVLNPGSQSHTSNYPVDWVYHEIFSQNITQDIYKKVNTGRFRTDEKTAIEGHLLMLAHMVRELQVNAKYAQQSNNVIPITSRGRSEDLDSLNPTKFMRAIPGNEQYHEFEQLNDIHPGLFQKVLNAAFRQFDELYGNASTVNISDWRRCDPDYVPPFNAGQLMEPYFGQRTCIDHNRAVVVTKGDINPETGVEENQRPYLQTHGRATTSALLEYTLGVGRKAELGIDPGRLSTFESWLEKMFPNGRTAADMEVKLDVMPSYSVGQQVEARATCTNLGATKYSGAGVNSTAFNAVCRISGIPDSADVKCTEPQLHANQSIQCVARFTPSRAQSIRLVAFANSHSFDPVPTMDPASDGNGITTAVVSIR